MAIIEKAIDMNVPTATVYSPVDALRRDSAFRALAGLAHGGWQVLRNLVLLLAVAAPLEAQMTGLAASDRISRENRLRPDSVAADGVDPATGAFIYERSVAEVQGGREILVDLSYNSLLPHEEGVLGPGWTHAFEARLEGDPTGVLTIHWGGGRKNSFRFQGDGQDFEPLDLTVRYDRLRKLSNGNFELTLYDGTRYIFSNNKLLDVFNKAGQRLKLAYSGGGPLTQIVEDISGRSVFFHYSPLAPGRLQHIDDAEDRVAFFGYDSQGRLSAIYAPGTTGAVHGDNFQAIPIPDNDPAGVTHVIHVSDTDPIGLVEFASATMNHDRPSDLRLKLTSPQGTSIELTNTQAEPGTWNLSELIVANFNGEDPQGDWTVRVVDTAAGGQGFLNTFRLVFTEPVAPTHFAYNSANQITEVTGPDGERILANTYDAAGRIIAQDDGRDDNQIAQFSYTELPSGGVRTTWTDRVGAVTTFDHDENYNPVRIVDPLQNETLFEYDQNGNRTSIRDARGATTRFTYDDRGNLTSTTDPLGSTWSFEYNSGDNLSQVMDPLGHTSTFSYDGLNNLIRARNALGFEDTQTFDGNSMMTGNLLDDGGGFTVGYTNGQPTSATNPAGGQAGTNAYDGIGRLTRTTDGDGYSKRFEYNSASQGVAETDELGLVTRTEYDRRGRRSRLIDPMGGVTGFQYDGNDNVVAVTDALGRVTRMAYDGEDRVIREIDPAGAATTLEYDLNGRLVAETGPLGGVTRREYDAAGNVTVEFDAKGVAISTSEYDPRGLVTASEDALGQRTTFDYDAAERLTKVTDPDQRETVFEYDDIDRPVALVDPTGRRFQVTYEHDDRINGLDDPRGNGETFRYDQANRMTRVSSAAGFTTLLSYNNRDLVNKVSYPSGRAVMLGYDNAGRLDFLNGTGSGLDEQNIFIDYDGNGNPTQLRRRPSAGAPIQPDSVWEYDKLNRPTGFTNVRGEQIHYEYDTAGNLSRLVYPNGDAVQYAYDAAGRMTRVTDWAGRVTEYSYDPNDQITRVDFPNGTARVMTYDPAGRVAMRRDVTAQGAVIVEYHYTYDAVGQIAVASSSFPQGPVYVPQPAVMTYAGSSDQLATFNGQTVSFDRDGNQIGGPLGDTAANFQYDSYGKLVQAGQVTYSYNAQDQLVGFVANGAETRLLINPEPAYTQVLEKRDPNGQVTRYVWGVGLIYEEDPNGIRVHHYDERGSTVAFSDASGSVVGRVAYGPFGEVGATTGNAQSLFQFDALFGVITDPNGLNYMRTRWYAPQIKRFLTLDPFFGRLGEPASYNLYSFAGNNPILLADPDGEFFNLIAAAIGAAVGAVVGVVANFFSDLADDGKLEEPLALAPFAGQERWL
jgi:RHS repeat-associated protein